MFITYKENGKVTAYSDKERNVRDLKKGEKEVEVDMDFDLIACEEGGLVYIGGLLMNSGKIIAKEVPKKKDVLTEVLDVLANAK